MSAIAPSAAPWMSRVVAAFEDRFRNAPVLIVLAAIWLYFDSRSDAYLSSQNITNLVL